MLRRNMTSAECQISDPKGRYLVFTLLFFQMPMMKTHDLNTKIITKKPKSARNCESRVSRTQVNRQVGRKQAQQWAQIAEGDSGYPVEAHNTNWLDRAGRQTAGWITGPVFAQLGKETGLAHITERPLRRSWAAIDHAAKNLFRPHRCCALFLTRLN